MKLDPVRRNSPLAMDEIEEGDAPDRRLPFSFLKDDFPGMPQAATNAFRASFIRVLAPVVAFLEQATVGNSTIIVPAVVTPLMTR